jgi:hypothetical protein
MVFKAKETSRGFMTAAFREDRPRRISAAIIPHLDMLGRGQYMLRECEECQRVGIGLSLILGASRTGRSETPPLQDQHRGTAKAYQRETKDHEEKNL